MKKFIVLACAVMMVFGVAGIASALDYYEAYTGEQTVSHVGDSYNFGFEFWETNDVYAVGTDSDLVLTDDAFGMNGDNSVEFWTAATLEIDFSSYDWFDEDAEITLTAWDGLNSSFDLGVFHFNGQSQNPSATFTHGFTQDQLTAFDVLDWGNVTITAALTWAGWVPDLHNNFYINRVAMSVTTEVVPEPSTVFLLGIGVLGLVGLGRKKFRK